jgi:hypothetical protein
MVKISVSFQTKFHPKLSSILGSLGPLIMKGQPLSRNRSRTTREYRPFFLLNCGVHSKESSANSLSLVKRADLVERMGSILLLNILHCFICLMVTAADVLICKKSNDFFNLTIYLPISVLILCHGVPDFVIFLDS